MICRCGVSIKCKYTFRKHVLTSRHLKRVEKQRIIHNTIPENTIIKGKRNLAKCMMVEKKCFNYFVKWMGGLFFFPNIGLVRALNMLPKKGKADTAISVKHFVNDRIATIGIQTKMGLYYRLENWIRPSKHPHIRNRREEWRNTETLSVLSERLRKYRNRRGCAHSKILKVSLCISNVDRGFGEVVDLDEKKLYVIGQVEDRYDFFYMDSRDIDTDFQPSCLEFVNDEFVSEMKLYYDLRPVYTSSGTTNLTMPDVFEGTFQEEVDIINKSVINIEN